MGARYLHVVDLDGAKQGGTVNLETIRGIRKAVGIPIQVGGGIRNAETVALYLNDIQVNRVILGTAAVRQPEFVRDMVGRYGADRILVGVDVKDGKVRTGGWIDDSGVDYLGFIETLIHMGVRTIVATDISRDGTLTSPNWDMASKIKGVNVIVSGGVSCEADVHRALDYYGVIVGKAFYERKVDLAAMMKRRIIPCLDIMDGKVVKGVNFVGLSKIGDPAEIAKAYEAQGADEIVLLDITATYENRETFCSLVQRVAGGLTVPVTVGGGMRSLSDIAKVLASGADKVSINSAFVANPGLIREASEAYGKRRIVAAIDGKKAGNGFHVFVRGGRDDTGLDVADWAMECERLGAGEILLTSMDRDGVQSGYDIPMTSAIAGCVDIPVVASGGCGSIGDIIEVFQKTGCDAALAASLFHYGKATIADVRAEMERNGIPCGTYKG